MYFKKIIVMILSIIFVTTAVATANAQNWIKTAIAGALIGAAIEHKKPLKGAAKGAALGAAVGIIAETMRYGYESYSYGKYPTYGYPRFYEKRESKCFNGYCEEHYYSTSPYGYSYSEQYYGNGRSYYYYERKEW
jgi:hypothetical protein